MAAPIGNTCPDIDKIVRKLDSIRRDIRRYRKDDESESLYDMLMEADDKIDDAMSAFEDLRRDNDTLRKWGKEMEEEAETAYVRIAELEDKIELVRTA